MTNEDTRTPLSEEQEAGLRDRLAENPSFKQLEEEFREELAGKPPQEQLAFIRLIQRDAFIDLANTLVADTHAYLLENQVAIPDATLQMLVAENAVSSILLRIIDSIRMQSSLNGDVLAATDAAFTVGLQSTFEDQQMLTLSEDEDTGQLREYMDQHSGVRNP